MAADLLGSYPHLLADLSHPALRPSLVRVLGPGRSLQRQVVAGPALHRQLVLKWLL